MFMLQDPAFEEEVRTAERETRHTWASLPLEASPNACVLEALIQKDYS